MVCMKQLFVVYLILFISYSCVNKQENSIIEKGNIEIPVCDVDKYLTVSVLDTFRWNDIATRTHLLPLHSTAPLGSAQVFYVGDNLILIRDAQTQSIYSFDTRGDLKFMFSHVGNGPGEYQYLSFVHFNECDSSLFVFDNGNLKTLTYTLSGTCLHENSVKDKLWGNISFVDENEGLYTKNTSQGVALVSILNDNLEIRENFLYFDSITTERRKTCVSLLSNKSSTFDLYLLNRASDDTVYTVRQKDVVPFCVLKKGTHALPEESSDNFLKLPAENDYFTYTTIDAFSSYILYRYFWQGKFRVELWNKMSEKKIANAELIKYDIYSGLEGGFNYVFNSGKSIRLLPNYVAKKRLVFLIPAEKCVGEIKGVKEDDNPILMIMNLK